MLFRKSLSTLVLLFCCSDTYAYSIAHGKLVEDFRTSDAADFKTSSGLWNIIDNRAQAAVAADASPSRTIDFGDGSDGVVFTNQGYTFDTDLRPRGFNFVSLTITGGTITVIGKHPLVIRSLTTVSIAPSISVIGGNGQNGQSGVLATALDFVNGGRAVTSSAHGGTGGAANPTGQNGTDGLRGDGTQDQGGIGGIANGGAAIHGSTSIDSPADFDFSGFIAGAGGGAGGGHSGAVNHSSGGGGGAGGGVVRIVSVGNLSVGTINASGGNGGSGKDEDGVNCNGTESGNGAGGNGGAVWLQTLKDLSAPNPTVDQGTGGTGLGCGAGNDGIPGLARGDAVSTSGALAATYSTANAAPGSRYVIQSKPYDLGTQNAKFLSATATTKIPTGGSILIEYAGSVDSSNFSEFTSDIDNLSNRNYRYVKFRITIRTADSAAASPHVNNITIDFTDYGLQGAELTLTPWGCGQIRKIKDDDFLQKVTQFTGLLVLCLISCFFLRGRSKAKSSG